MDHDSPLVEVTVTRMGLDSASTAYVLILREREGSGILPIWIGRSEAESIAMQISGISHPRPMTHDLCRMLITGLGYTLRRVNITHVAHNTYHATLQLHGPAGPVELDARPSDGIAIALRCEAPIYAARELLNDINDDDAWDESSPPMPIPDSASDDLTKDATEDEFARQLKAHLERLRPEDFGRFRP